MLHTHTHICTRPYPVQKTRPPVAASFRSALKNQRPQEPIEAKENNAIIQKQTAQRTKQNNKHTQNSTLRDRFFRPTRHPPLHLKLLSSTGKKRNANKKQNGLGGLQHRLGQTKTPGPIRCIGPPSSRGFLARARWSSRSDQPINPPTKKDKCNKHKTAPKKTHKISHWPKI